MSFPIPAVGEIIIVSMEYDPTGLAWVRLWDNHALGWLVSDAPPEAAPEAKGRRGASHVGGGFPGSTRAEREAAPEPRKPSGETPPATTGEHAPIPIILGSLAVKAPDTSPVQSPQWGKYDDPVVFMPDLGRMLLPDFLTWLATNNGAQRRIGSAAALSKPLIDGLQQWGVLNPDLAFKGAPQSAPPVNVDVPVILPDAAAVGDTLTCTMGNWDGMQGEPADYAYQWLADGIDTSATGPTYAIPPGDAGHSITCVVTATNMAGSTAAPPSNPVAIPAATTAAAAAGVPMRPRSEKPDEEDGRHKLEEARHASRRRG
jgi:hypothetical protein